MAIRTVDREQQGQLIAQANGSVKRINEKEYVVNSQSNGGTYHVHMSGPRLGLLMS
jgi:hypothetical protein